MCTIIALNQVHPQYTLIIAANRDELLTRSSSPPRVHRRDNDSPQVLAGIDNVAGGTWMGVSERGFFVGITNQRDATPSPDTHRSRGEVVLNALNASSVDDVLSYLSTLSSRRYRPFNLLFGDGLRLFVAYAHREMDHVEVHQVPPGVHVLPNDRLNAASWPKVVLAQRLAAPLVDLPWEDALSGLKRLLADRSFPDCTSSSSLAHHQPLNALARPLDAICVEVPGYGTCSSTVVALNPRLVAHYLYADGPSDRASFNELAHLIH